MRNDLMQDLAGRLTNRVQLTTDGYRPYLAAVEDAFGGEIDYASAIEVERDAGLVGSDQRQNNLSHIATGKIMRFQWIARYFNARFHRSDAIVDN